MRFIARQPVFDSELRVVGYELLFRSGMEDFARITDGTRAACTTLDNSVLWGIDQLCDSKLALVNCTREVITSGLVQVLPPSRTVVEVLEDIDADGDVIAACRDLKRKGYVIALDDVTSIDEVKPYLGVAQVVKVDFRLTSKRKQVEIARWLHTKNIEALAEKVETREEYQSALRMGFELFQGFFLQRPETIRGQDIPALQANYIRLIEAVQNPELDFELVEQAIRSEPSMCFRLLRYLNSPLFGFADNVDSIRHGLQLLGERNVRNWLLVAVTSVVGEGKPSELVVWALTRARFCELVAIRTRQRPDGMFLAGMLSAFPSLLDAKLEDILDGLTVSANIRAALLDAEGVRGNVLQLAAAYEAGDWSNTIVSARSCGLAEEVVSDSYLQAAAWADQVTEVGIGIARINSAMSSTVTP